MSAIVYAAAEARLAPVSAKLFRSDLASHEGVAPTLVCLSSTLLQGVYRA
jgi:hypothetical protein